MIAFVDIETSSFSKHKNALCEIAVVIVNGYYEVIDSFSCLIQPYCQEDGTPCVYEDRAMAIHGLTIEQLKSEGLEVGVALELIISMFEKHNVAYIGGHNVKSFDYPWIKYLMDRFCNIDLDFDIIDTMIEAKKLLKLPSYKLADLCKHYGIINDTAHRALEDCMATLKLYKAINNI